MREQEHCAHSRSCHRSGDWAGAYACNRHAKGRQPVRSTQRKDRFERQLRIRQRAGRTVSFSASRAGYLEQNFDQPSPFARYRLLELAEGEQLDGMDLRLRRGTIIAGAITDERRPLPDALVQVMRERFGPADARSERKCGHR